MFTAKENSTKIFYSKMSQYLKLEDLFVPPKSPNRPSPGAIHKRVN